MALLDIFSDLKAELTGGKTIMQQQLPNLHTGFAPAIGGAVGSVWRGLGTTGKYAVVAGAGAGAYAAYDWLFGGSTKKEQSVAQQAAPQDQKQSQPTVTTPSITVNHAPYETYEPKIDIRNIFQNDYSTNIIYNSPNSGITKKQAADASGSTPGSWNTPSTYSQPTTVSPSQAASQEQAQTATQQQGMDWATIAAIAGVALVAYGYTSRKGSK